MTGRRVLRPVFCKHRDSKSKRNGLFVFSERIEPSEITDQVQTGKPDQRVYNSGEHTHIAEKEADKIELKKADQSPVDCSDDGDDQNGIVKTF